MCRQRGRQHTVACTTITCTRLAGNVNTNVRVKRSLCTVAPPAGYGTFLHGLGSVIWSLGGTLTWTGNGDSLTLAGITRVNLGPGPCAPGWTEYTLAGTVAGASADTFDSALVGGAFSATTCEKPNGKIKLAPGGTINF